MDQMSVNTSPKYLRIHEIDELRRILNSPFEEIIIYEPPKGGERLVYFARGMISRTARAARALEESAILLKRPSLCYKIVTKLEGDEIIQKLLDSHVINKIEVQQETVG